MENKNELIRYFKDLYLLEKEARDMYVGFLSDLKDPDVFKQVDKIRKEEEGHMKIAEKIISIIEKY